jgi:hypothetical protein
MMASGTLFEAWLNPRMSIRDRIISAFRARFWLHICHEHIIKMSSKFGDLYSSTRSFISPASFHIFNRLCDTLVLLVIAYRRYYPDQPFCPWLLGTEFLEHFFGLARMLLPNFTFAEFWKMVQHIMVRQQILSTGKFTKKQERTSAVGYIMDFDTSHMTAEDQYLQPSTLDDQDIRLLIETAHSEAIRVCKDIISLPIPSLPFQLKPLGAHSRKKKAVTANESDENSDSAEDSDGDAIEDGDDESDKAIADGMSADDISPLAADAAEHSARYSALCEDYNIVVAELTARDGPTTSTASVAERVSSTIVVSAPATSAVSDAHLNKSSIIDDSGKASITLILRERERLQGGTTAKSERVVRIDPKFALKKVVGPDGEPIMTVKEASHLVRVIQDLDSGTTKATKTRVLRWQATCRKIQGLVESKRESLTNR